jgi:D-serine deaminase-like pyridoxal phosphate-dependent protein
MQVAFGVGTLADCALTVLATVVSRPTGDRAVLDAGSKALSSDLSPAPGYGHVVEFPGAAVTSLSEEHAVVDLPGAAARPAIGDRVRIIPNHVCVVSNLFDFVHLVDGEQVIETLPVAARGKVG